MTILAIPADPQLPTIPFTYPEEFEEQRVEGEDYTFQLDEEEKPGDRKLWDLAKVTESTLPLWEEVEALESHNRAALYGLMKEEGCALDDALRKIRDGDCYIYPGTPAEYFRDRAADFGYLSQVPECLQGYIDWESYAEDMCAEGNIYTFHFDGEDWLLEDY